MWEKSLMVVNLQVFSFKPTRCSADAETIKKLLKTFKYITKSLSEFAWKRDFCD